MFNNPGLSPELMINEYV